MNFEQRLTFYLGNISLDILSIENINTFTINEYIHNDENFKCLDGINKKRQATELKNLLQKTKNIDKGICAVFGDITTISKSYELCKNRCPQNNNSVLLRCFDYKRHWKKYYNILPDIPFDKKKNKIFWRGTTTGKITNLGNRFDLVTKWFNKTPNIDVSFSFICQNKENFSKYVKGKCSVQKFLEFKYIISVEGNDKDSGLNWKLNSNSLVMMPKPKVCSWLMETTLIPDVHYILLKNDFSNLENKLKWCNNHPNKCKQIIKNANKFMDQFSNKKQEEYLEETVINIYFKILNSNNNNITPSE
jgi:hypothetical protein